MLLLFQVRLPGVHESAVEDGADDEGQPAQGSVQHQAQARHNKQRARKVCYYIHIFLVNFF